MNFAAAGDFPLGIVPGFRYNETESDISGAEEKMLKFKIMLVVFIALVYYGVTYCMLSPGICKYYADYYLLSARSFSIDEERAFLHKPITETTNYFRTYRFNGQNRNFKVLGFVRFDDRGIWSTGNTVRMSFRLPQVYSSVWLDFEIDPYVNKKNENVFAEVYLDDRKIDEWNFQYGRKMPANVEVCCLCKNYDRIRAVDNVSFKAGEGEVIALLGPNGAGKSTLMNMMAGYLAPSAGDIFICGRNIRDFPLEGKQNVGFLPEGSPLYPDLTVRAFLNYMAGLRLLDKRAADRAIALAKIENVAEQKIETLSKGYQRRVGFAQSILSDPPVLLLDEPTDGLDPNQKRHIRSLIGQMGKKKTIMISTHLLDEAETVCNRIILINRGRIVADGTAGEIIKKAGAKNLEEAFCQLTTTEDEA